MSEPFHPYITALLGNVIYPENDAWDAYLSSDIMSQARHEIAARYHEEPALCIHALYLFLRCHDRGLVRLGRQLIQLAAIGLSQSVMEELVAAKRHGNVPSAGVVNRMPAPRAGGVGLGPRGRRS